MRVSQQERTRICNLPISDLAFRINGIFFNQLLQVVHDVRKVDLTT